MTTTPDVSDITPEEAAWDATDPMNPQPRVYPVCSTCKVPYVWKWCMFVQKPACFAWVRDCKHKAPAEIHRPERTD